VLIDLLVARGVGLTYREYEMGHEIWPEALRDLVSWLEEKVLSRFDSCTKDLPRVGVADRDHRRVPRMSLPKDRSTQRNCIGGDSRERPSCRCSDI